MRRLFVLFAACAALMCVMSSVNAQNRKMGKPTAEEWAVVVCDSMPEAEAIVLYKSVEVTYEVSNGGFEQYGNAYSEMSVDNVRNSGINHLLSEGNTTMIYDVKLRIKVLKDSGARFANVDIVTYNSEKELEELDDFYSCSVMLFEQVNGKEKKHRVAAKDITDERVDGNFMVRHICVPEAKAGDIIEYQYKLFSRRAAFLYDWQLQEQDIPVQYSYCHMEIPAFISFNMQVPIHPLVSKKAEQGLMRLPQAVGDMKAPKTIKTNCFTIEAKNILPRACFSLENGNAAKVSADGQLYEVRSVENIPNVQKPLPLPAGKRHIMIGKL